MKKLLLIYNARSGKTMVKRNLADIIDVFIKAGYQVEAYQTQKKEDAKEQVIARGHEFDLVVCCGGDGTLNETVNGIMLMEEPPLLGYVPAGSTNDFATSLHLPKNMIKAAEVAAGGRPVKVDIGNFNNKYFVYIAGFGAFTDVSYQTPQDLKNIFGHNAYMIEAIKALPKLRSYKIKCEFNDCVLEGDFLYGMISNSSSVGGFKGITGREISLCDGLFEVTLIKPPKNIAELQVIITELLSGKDDSKNVIRFKTDRLVVSSVEKVAWVLDGECGGSYNRAVITNEKNSLAIKANKQ